ncbi:type II toxin-antitoxin system VapC family toxin [Hephaestia caeni]|uniref:type II toxin-antitoxin system VapC family toxin n=1 Tax=Hephaestia caeni TaxID=645617 RepID=UPI0011C43320|nr:type II toxin-antitoxin system VapC family toxin [Hephaestia caeni]
MLAANPLDPLTKWIEEERVRPLIAITTMAQALDAIRMDPTVDPADRKTLERRYDDLARELRIDKRESVLTAEFDLKSAEILADLLSVGAAEEEIGEMDLVAAAIAVQHNMDLVVVENSAAWEAFAAAIPPESGRLSLRVISPAD